MKDSQKTLTLTQAQLRERDMAASALTCDAILILFVLGCLFLFFFIGENEEMTGVKALRYFTVHSCIASALVSSVTAGYILRWLITGRPIPRGAACMKFAGISSICITFTVTMSIFVYTLCSGIDAFGTELGFSRILSGSNLFMHLICPLLGISSLIMEPGARLRWRDLWTAYVPVTVYSILYIIFALHLSRENGGWTDIYSVSRAGIAFSAAAVAVITLAVSAALIKLQHIFKPQPRKTD